MLQKQKNAVTREVMQSVNNDSRDIGRTRKIKIPRKSRSQGLRTKTGCITCRKRHKKCNEALPVCGNCATTDRTCIWPDVQQQSYASTTTSQVLPNEAEDAVRSRVIHNYDLSSPLNASHPQYPAPDEIRQFRPQLQSPYPSHVSPSNTVSSESLTADLASVRWLDLLATDASQADNGFTRRFRAASTQDIETGVNGITSIDEQSFPGPSESLTARVGDSWQLDSDIILKSSEVLIFRNFVEHSSLWLDLFDPLKHFSDYTLRLAPRNVGLMKAILALSAQHLSRQDRTNASDTANGPNLAIQYYYETLHYVQTALHYNSYAHSEELLVTALIISTYEMLDESNNGWQRHLKGVFWIQRSQNVNGASRGIKQAVWWAWLRQDVWAAFRERRRCLSFWKPVKDYPELTAPDLIDRATYLFSQAVNYCADQADPEIGDSVQRRLEAAQELLAMLDRWMSFAAEQFKRLPVCETGSVFQPIWIHPPQLGVALQTFYFARILIILHRPAMPGFTSYLKVQKSLSEAVAVICGVAMELKDEGCQIISSQCLFGAGLCVQDVAQRHEIISLIGACEARTGWPMSSLREQLYQEWKKGDSSDLEQETQSRS